MDLPQILSEMTGYIKGICKTAECPLNDAQAAHISNILIPYANKLSKQNGKIHEAKGIIRALIGAHLPAAWKPHPRLIKLATEFTESH